ncbi:uncharacterized protein LODBEIA_P05000 [Lodderomyces beijingensis]|uniref:RRM domain-containing protein n=1 Tax=Lodderomyces beijingensis TaxID=1775926 RepID=A0ABP0ZGK3_9ASCO
MSEVAPAKLSKKEKKSKQFRKSKEERDADKLDKQESKKRKLEQAEAEAEAEAEATKPSDAPIKSKDQVGSVAESGSEEPAKKKRKTRRGKKGKGSTTGSGEPRSPRFILFVGNLPYDIKKAELIAHFSKCGPDRIRVRSNKGIAFLEFDNDTKEIQSKMESALRLHHSEIRQRKINVELTVGGGGNSENRQQKLKEKNEKAVENRRKMKEAEEKKKKEKSKVSERDLGGLHPSRAALMQ